MTTQDLLDQVWRHSFIISLNIVLLNVTVFSVTSHDPVLLTLASTLLQPQQQQPLARPSRAAPFQREPLVFANDNKKDFLSRDVGESGLPSRRVYLIGMSQTVQHCYVTQTSAVSITANSKIG